MRPADIGNWGFLQVMQEGGRLLRQHFGDFLPAIIVFILPATLIHVVHGQCSPRYFVPPPSFSFQGSTEETAWIFDKYVDKSLIDMVLMMPLFFNGKGATWMFDELTNVVYNSHVAVE